MARLRILFLYLGVPALLLLLSYNGGTGTTAPGRPDVQLWCEYTAGTEGRECAHWGDAILAHTQELPADPAPENITRIEIERALWGLVDRCTAKIAYFGNPDPTHVITTPCR